MKRASAKPDDSRLQFFTRELYVKGNSRDDAIADEVEEKWEQAIERYQRHLRQLHPKLPRGAREFEKISLHDGVLLDEPRMSASGEWGRIAVAGGIMSDQSTTHLLRYELAAAIRRIRYKVEWPFSNRRVEWLYDELDMSKEHRDCFIHRILLSDGSVVVVPFRDADLQAWPSELLEGLRRQQGAATAAAKKTGRELRAIVLH